MIRNACSKLQYVGGLVFTHNTGCVSKYSKQMHYYPRFSWRLQLYCWLLVSSWKKQENMHLMQKLSPRCTLTKTQLKKEVTNRTHHGRKPCSSGGDLQRIKETAMKAFQPKKAMTQMSRTGDMYQFQVRCVGAKKEQVSPTMASAIPRPGLLLGGSPLQELRRLWSLTCPWTSRDILLGARVLGLFTGWTERF